MPIRIPKVLALLILFAGALTQASPAQAQWTLTAGPASASPGATFTVNWTAPSGSSATDWIGLFKIGGSAGLYSYVYTGGATSGSANMGAPEELGNFEFRYFLNNTNNQVAASNSVAVANAAINVAVQPNSTVSGELTHATVSWSASTSRPATDWVALIKVGDPDSAYVSWAYTGGAQNGNVQLAMPTQPATYRVKYFLNNSLSVGASGNSVLVVPDFPVATLFASPTFLEIGEGSLELFFTAPTTRTSTDWIAMYVAGAPPGEELWWQYTDGEAGGSYNFPAPTVPGEYEFRYYSNNSINVEAISDTIFAVPPAGTFSLAATLSNEPGTGIPSIRSQWSVPPGRPTLDWIGLYDVNSPDSGPIIRWFYARGLATGDVHIPRPGSGTYELRYFANNGWARIATSNQIEVP